MVKAPDELKTDDDHIAFIMEMRPGSNISLRQWRHIVLRVIQILIRHSTIPQ